MPTKEVALDVARFLDSPEAGALTDPDRAQVRRIAEHFLAACYEDLGKAPHLVDAEDVRALTGTLLPGRLAPRDPLAEHLPAVLGAWLDHLEGTRVVTQSFEVRRALDETLDDLVETVRAGRNVPRGSGPQEPLVHRAPKLGRNDPCFCGSGKKFKKCHGRSAG